MRLLPLKLVNILRRISQFFQVSSELSLVLGALLASTDSLVHPWRSANKDLVVTLSWFGKYRLEELLGDKSFTSPVRPLGFLVEQVEGLKALRVGVF